MCSPLGMDESALAHTYRHSLSRALQTRLSDGYVESDSNQLTSMTSAGNQRDYTYDAAGNLLDENTERHHEWDWGGRMRAFRNQTSGSQASVFAHYTYGSGGQRVQKVVSKSSGDPVHSVYIDGVFEHHVEIDGTGTPPENNVLHVMDDAKRVATKRLGSELDGSTPPAVQYHLGDHLQSSNVVLKDDGSEYSREEYRPYGESSFGSFQKKRYRFTGKERDEESSLNYHGARYYAAWAARWTAPDPKGMVDGSNLYQYVSGNPVRFNDPSGTQQANTAGSEDSMPSQGIEQDSGGSQDGGTDDEKTKAQREEVGKCYVPEKDPAQLGETNEPEESAIERNRRNVREGNAPSVSAQRGRVQTYKQWKEKLQRQFDTLGLLGVSFGASVAVAMAYSKGARGTDLDRAARLGYAIEGAVTVGAVSSGRARTAAKLESYTGKEIPFNRGMAPIKLHEGGQGKHVRGEHNFDPSRSELTVSEPAKLIEGFAGSGTPLNKVPKGKPGYRERVDFGKNIGIYRNKKGTVNEPTNRGIIHYSKRGLKIVPSRPKGQ